MKLLIVTIVDEFQHEAMRLFKESHIDRFSGSEIDGFKELPSLLMNSSWFPKEKGGAESTMFFSFTEEEKIDAFLELAKEFNETLETDNPIRAIVVPIEKFI